MAGREQLDGRMRPDIAGTAGQQDIDGASLPPFSSPLFHPAAGMSSSDAGQHYGVVQPVKK